MDSNPSIKTLEEIVAIYKTTYYNVSSRALYLEKEHPNFSEVFNDSFIITESLRESLRQLVVTKYRNIPLEQNLISVLEQLLMDIVDFQVKWSVSYTSWLSSFKSHRQNRDYFNSGSSHIQLDYQINFPGIQDLNRDHGNLISKITKALSKIQSISTEIDLAIEELTYKDTHCGLLQIILFYITGKFIVFYYMNRKFPRIE